MRYLLSLILIFALSSTVFATDYHGECAIAFKGSSTLHDFHGKAACQPFTVSRTDGVVDMSNLTVAVAGMDTDNSKRDKKMREMFEENKYPVITGTAGPVALKDVRDKVSFKLKIRDIVKPVTATVTNFVETDSRITADVAFTLSLAEYQLKPPSVLGMIKVGDKISVKATIVLSRK